MSPAFAPVPVCFSSHMRPLEQALCSSSHSLLIIVSSFIVLFFLKSPRASPQSRFCGDPVVIPTDNTKLSGKLTGAYAHAGINWLVGHLDFVSERFVKFGAGLRLVKQHHLMPIYKVMDGSMCFIFPCSKDAACALLGFCC